MKGRRAAEVEGTIQTRPPAPPFGRLLRQWRDVRRISQLELALQAEVSSRHVSFLETGRSQPSRAMVVRLSQVLDLPLRDRNVLLEAAGFARLYGESDLTDPELARVRQVIEFILDRQEPYGAVAVDRRWNVLLANRGHERMLDFLLDGREHAGASGNLARLVFDEGGLKPFVVNWEQVARAVLERARREVAGRADEEEAAWLESLLSAPGVPERWRAPDPSLRPPVVIPIQLRKGDFEVSLFTAITTLGTPLDVTLQELRIESFFPADEESDRRIRELADR